jgi:hypothetical protein
MLKSDDSNSKTDRNKLEKSGNRHRIEIFKTEESQLNERK